MLCEFSAKAFHPWDSMKSLWLTITTIRFLAFSTTLGNLPKLSVISFQEAFLKHPTHHLKWTKINLRLLRQICGKTREVTVFFVGLVVVAVFSFDNFWMLCVCFVKDNLSDSAVHSNTKTGANVSYTVRTSCDMLPWKANGGECFICFWERMDGFLSLLSSLAAIQENYLFQFHLSGVTGRVGPRSWSPEFSCFSTLLLCFAIFHCQGKQRPENTLMHL